ncbi:MAG: two-component system nitrate/nitrite response regulator NarL [Cocleimonas sp.]|jgi:two-component system nitrate/nitrite response regulator NarL
MSATLEKQPTETKTINILLADDHPLVQDGLRTRFNDIEDINVIGVANDGEELLEKARLLKPDVVITDISMPKMNGLKATHLLSQELPDINVLILTMHDNKEYIQNAIDSGAKGYILKDKPAAEMIAAVRAINKGDTHFCSTSVKAINPSTDKKDPDKLTTREQAILMELLNGLKNKHISEKLNISVRTVECHRGNIYRKLDTHSMTGLIRYAKKVGYI